MLPILDDQGSLAAPGCKPRTGYFAVELLLVSLRRRSLCRTPETARGINTLESSKAATVNAFIAAINRRDVTRMAELMTEDHTFVDSGGTVESGRENTIKGWEGYFRMFPDYSVRVDCLLEDGAFVAAFGSASGTFNGKRGMVPANRVEMPAAWKAMVEDGKIKSWQVYADWTEGSRIIREDKLHD